MIIMKHIKKFNESESSELDITIKNNVKSDTLKNNDFYIVYEESEYYPVGIFSNLDNFINCYVLKLKEIGLLNNSSVIVNGEDDYKIIFECVFDDNSEGDYKFYYEVINVDTYYSGYGGHGLPTWYFESKEIKSN